MKYLFIIFSEVASLILYLDAAHQKERSAKEDLAAFSSELQQRAERAEDQLMALQKRLLNNAIAEQDAALREAKNSTDKQTSCFDTSVSANER